MAYIILTGIIIISICLFDIKSKIGYCLILLYMFGLYAFNTNNADFSNYLNKFEFAINSTGVFTDNEPGFTFLSRLINFFGGSYNHLLFVIASLGFIIINITINKYTKNKAFVMVLYMFFPFFLDVVQVRFFITTIIFLFSFKYLMKPDLKYDFYFIICILIATTFHYSSILLLPTLFTKHISSKKIIFVLPAILIIGAVFTYGNLGYQLLALIMPSQKASTWLENRTSFGSFIYIIIHIIEISYVYISAKIYTCNTKNILKNEKNKFIEYILRMNLILSYITIFYAYSITFFRIYRVLILLNYVLFSLTLESFTNKSKRYYLYKISILTLSIGYFLFMILPGKERTLLPILSQNLFLH